MQKEQQIAQETYGYKNSKAEENYFGNSGTDLKARNKMSGHCSKKEQSVSDGNFEDNDLQLSMNKQTQQSK